MKRGRHSSHFKSQVVLENIRGEETVSQIAFGYNIHSSQVQAWKSTALEGFSSVFEKSFRGYGLMN